LATANDSLEAMLTRTDSSALLVLQHGALVHAWYDEGVGHDTIHISFSMTKTLWSCDWGARRARLTGQCCSARAHAS